jgi:putative ABC transport system permease protein
MSMSAQTNRAAHRSQVRPADAVALGSLGLRARRVRTTLSALGIAIAIGALVAVLGIAASSKAELLNQLGAEGNLLTVAAGQTFTGNPTPLPATAEQMIAAIGPVQEVTAVGDVPGATARRSAAVPAIVTGGISVVAAQPSLLHTLSATLLHGQFLGALAQRYPEVVLGYSAAQNLGINTLSASSQIYISGQYFAVVGILAPVAVAPEIDDAVLVSFPVAGSRLGLSGGRPTRIYLRAEPDQVPAVAGVLPFTASPASPEAVEVRRPSDILLARISAKATFVGLFLGLGAVALLVGGVGIANIMVISVLERRGEIGLRRALGARARHVAAQFLLESAVLAILGGVAGVVLGCLATLVAAHLGHTRLAIPLIAPMVGIVAALGVGTLAGVYPAIRAARLAPADALRSL